MSLSCYEYFKNNKHIKELQNLNNDINNKLYHIIHEFYKEIENLNDKKKNTQLKDLKKLCDKTTEIIKDIKIILISYKCVYHDELFTPNNIKKEKINDILEEMEYIELILKDLKNLKINSLKVKKLTDDLLLFIRLLNLLITELNNN